MEVPGPRVAGAATYSGVMSTLHYQDTRAEVHKVVVGPMANNVFVVRCRETGAAVLIDAANEHERLLELCAALGVREVLETHGHWDHIQAVPAVRDAGYSVHVTEADAHMLDSYDEILEDESAIEVGRLRLHTIHTPGHTAGSMCFLLDGAPVLFSGDTLFPGGPGATGYEGRRLRRHHRVHRSPPVHAPSRHPGLPGPRSRHHRRHGTPEARLVDRAGVVTASPAPHPFSTISVVLIRSANA